MNHGVLLWARSCESWIAMLCQILWIMMCILRQWLWIIVSYAKPIGCASWCAMLIKLVVNHDALCWAQWLGIMVCYAEPVVVNHGLLCSAKCCESWCVILSQWLWIMVSYGKPTGYESWCAMLSKVVVNHDALCWAQWLGIMVCYTERVVVNHGLLCWVSGCEWCFIMLSQWFWIMVYHAEPVVVNHGELSWSSGYESWCVMLS